jgi:hypothetical protein
MPPIEEQNEQHFALSYGPEDAFMLHRYHRPPRGSAELRGDSRPPSPAQQPLPSAAERSSAAQTDNAAGRQ